MENNNRQLFLFKIFASFFRARLVSPQETKRNMKEEFLFIVPSLIITLKE